VQRIGIIHELFAILTHISPKNGRENAQGRTQGQEKRVQQDTHGRALDSLNCPSLLGFWTKNHPKKGKNGLKKEGGLWNIWSGLRILGFWKRRRGFKV
jgi:hypothetical protein